MRQVDRSPHRARALRSPLDMPPCRGRRIRAGAGVDRCASRICIAAQRGVWAAASWIASLGPAPFGEGLAFSTLVVDRDGKLLRPYTTPEGAGGLPATREDVDPRFLDLLFAYEDKRFRTRITASIRSRWRRALVQLITHRRIVSGGSTLTMQVARLLEPRAERSLRGEAAPDRARDRDGTLAVQG